MGIWEIIVGALVLLFSIVMIIVIILQEGHEAGLGTITGGADSFLSRGKARTADAIFARMTKYCAIAFFILVVLLNAMQYFGFTGAAKENTTAETSQTSVVSEASKEDSKAESSAEAKTEDSKAESKAESTEASKTESSVQASAAESSAASTASTTESSAAASSSAQSSVAASSTASAAN